VFGRDARVVAVSQARLSVSAAAQARHSLPFVRVHGWQALLRWVGEWRGSQRSNLVRSERCGLLDERRTMKFVPPPCVAVFFRHDSSVYACGTRLLLCGAG